MWRITSLKGLKKKLVISPYSSPDYAARLTLALLSLAAGISYAFGPASWHIGPIYTTTEFLHVPIQAYGILLIAVALLLFFAPFVYKGLAYILGGVVYTTFSMCLLIHFSFHGTVSLSSIAITAALAVWFWLCAYRATILIGEVDE